MVTESFAASDTVSFAELWRRAVLVRWYALAGAVIVAVLTAAIALWMDNIYRAQVTLLPVISDDNDNPLGGLAAQFGGLAAATGVKLGGDSQRSEALEYLKSRTVVERFIESGKLLPLLCAEDAADCEAPLSDPLAMNEASRYFRNKVRKISEDKRTGVVTLNIEWRDRAQAREWANRLVERTNDDLRDRAVSEAQGKLSYLEHALTETAVTEVRQALYRIVESQLKTIAIASARRNYAFRVIDPAPALGRKDRVRPQRALMVVAGALLGLLLGGGVKLLRESKRERGQP